jgi:ComF family protein
MGAHRAQTLGLRSLVEDLAGRLRDGVCEECGCARGPVCARCREASDCEGHFIAVPAHQAALDGLLRLGRYYVGDGVPTPLASALLRFKYQGDRAAGHALRTLVARAAARSTLGAGLVVVPVPLHSRRLRERGYNQAAWLARGAARGMRAGLDTRALSRVVDTPPQAGAHATERRRMRSAFVGCEARLAGRAILLVDDVYTTGMTVSAAAHAAREAGARDVFAAVLLLAGRG